MYYSSTRYAPVLAVLERIAKDPAHSKRVRAHAVAGIHSVCKDAAEDAPAVDPDGFDEESVDWVRVEAMLADARSLPGRQR